MIDKALSGELPLYVDRSYCLPSELCSTLKGEISSYAVLQIRRGNRDNFGIISHIFFNKNIFCDPSLELSR